MFCNTSFEKICIYACSCDNCVNLSVSSPLDQKVLVKWEFNNKHYEQKVDAIANQNIKIANRFNENYTHKLLIFNENGSLLTNKIFNIKVSPCNK